MKPKIAIIEDEVAISQMYRFKLEAEGYAVETAENGKLGLELVEKMKPDIILLDLMMPEMNGEDMLEKVRATDWGKSIKVIILTNITQEAEPPKLASLQIERYIVKANYTPAQVAAIVAEVLGSPPR